MRGDQNRFYVRACRLQGCGAEDGGCSEVSVLHFLQGCPLSMGILFFPGACL
jgi:hypothetical protein